MRYLFMVCLAMTSFLPLRSMNTNFLPDSREQPIVVIVEYALDQAYQHFCDEVKRTYTPSVAQEILTNPAVRTPFDIVLRGDCVEALYLIASLWTGERDTLKQMLLSFISGRLEAESVVLQKFRNLITQSDCTFKSYKALRDAMYHDGDARGIRCLWKPRGATQCDMWHNEDHKVRARVPSTELFEDMLFKIRFSYRSLFDVCVAIRSIIEADIQNGAYSREVGMQLITLFKLCQSRDLSHEISPDEWFEHANSIKGSCLEAFINYCDIRTTVEWRQSSYAIEYFVVGLCVLWWTWLIYLPIQKLISH